MKGSKIDPKRLLAELAVIFAGVTLSFLADDWREYRSDRDSERVLLEQILTDLEGDSADITASVAPLLVQDRNAARLLTGWHQSLDADTVADLLDSFNDGEPYAGQRAAFSALKSAGRLNLVMDGAIRARIVGYYETGQTSFAAEMEEYFREWAELYDILAPHVKWAPPASDTSTLPTVQGGSQLVRGWSALQREVDVYNHIRSVGIRARVTADEAERLLAENRVLRQRVANALGRVVSP